MATTPKGKITTGGDDDDIYYDKSPPYLGDRETFRSGSGKVDDYDPVTREASVEGRARQINMRDMPGKNRAGGG